MKRSFQDCMAEFVASVSRGWTAEGAWQRVELALLDTLAVSVAGADDPGVSFMPAYLQQTGAFPGGRCTWVTPATRSLEHAALVAGALAHALDYDDVAAAWRGHPSAVLLPALAAVGVRVGATGDDLADAYAVGFEVGSRLGRAVAGRHYEKGWHSTATIGVIAATAACARLARLKAAGVSSALGLAVAQAGGIQANFGTHAKALHAGFAAAAAVRSLLLAESGVTASSAALEGPGGFADLLADGFDGSVLEESGDVRPALLTGVEIKLYPACYAAHRALEAALSIRDAHAIDIEEVSAIEIEGPVGAHKPLLGRLPATAAEAKFSAEYLVACALVDGAVGLSSFQRPPDDDPRIARLMTRAVVRETTEQAPVRWGSVRIRTKNGRDFAARVTALRGSSACETSATAVLEKASDCLRASGIGADGQQLVKAVRDVRFRDVGLLFESRVVQRIRDQIWRLV